MRQRASNDTRNVEELTLSEMAFETVAEPPRMVILGTDSTGVERSAEVVMDYFHHVPTHELREQYMHELGQQVAGHKPYTANIEEIHYWKKQIVDLRSEGFDKEQEALVVCGINIPDATFGTHAFVVQGKHQDALQVHNVESLQLDHAAEQSHIIDELKVFLGSYVRHKPVSN
jgi:hypothetical protein